MIVEATLPLLIEHGEMVTTRQIADAAGIAEGTIFRVFPDKDSLIEAVVEAAFDTGPLELALRGLERGRPLRAEVEAAVVVLQHRVVHLWRLASSIGPRFRDTTRRSLAISPQLVELFGAHVDELRVEPPEAARLLQAITLAVTHPVLTEEPMTAVEVARLLLEGVGGGDPRC